MPRITDANGRFIAQDAPARFWAKVTTAGVAACWLWRGTVKPDGYGSFSIGRRTITAHRYSWFLHTGQEPGDSLVCHHCDTPLCVNPSHLFTGTTQDNIADKLAKGRQRAGRGDRHGSKTHPENFKRGRQLPQTRLDDDKVRWARGAAEDGESQSWIGARLGVSGSTIGKVLRRETWAHVK